MRALVHRIQDSMFTSEDEKTSVSSERLSHIRPGKYALLFLICRMGRTGLLKERVVLCFRGSMVYREISKRSKWSKAVVSITTRQVRTGSAGQALGGKVKVARKRGGKEARKAVKPQHGGDSRGCGLL